jgi:hypothetical protein
MSKVITFSFKLCGNFVGDFVSKVAINLKFISQNDLLDSERYSQREFSHLNSVAAYPDFAPIGDSLLPSPDRQILRTDAVIADRYVPDR